MSQLSAVSVAKATAGGPTGSPLQRKCACGSGASELTGECSDCQREKALGRQAKLAVGAADHPLEREADRAAERVMAMRGAPGELSYARRPVLSRFTAGGDAGVGADVPASVHGALQAAGEPLPATLRDYFEPRFGHDFGRVRVHHDMAAAQSARAVNASAYTVGERIVFGTSRYAPGSTGGRGLIAHELAHVVQQGASTPAAPVQLQRRGFFEELAGLFAGDTFDEQTLTDYLDVLRRTQRIEDYTDSDNKARALVKAWKEGDSPYALTEDLKALLILEMLSGFTGDDDEQAILELLERSYNFELAYIFGTGGVTVDKLNSAFQGREQTCLDDFYTRRFAGGEAALASGTVEPQGDAVRFAEPVQTNCAQAVSGLPGIGVDWSMPCVLGILCSEDQQVVEDLTRFDVQSVDSIDVDRWEYDGTTWAVAETRHPSGAADAHTSTPEIRLLRGRSCDDAVRTVVHEVRHQNQPAGSRLSEERDAYTYTEQWTIDRGLPGYGNFRTTDPQTGRPAVDVPKVETYVQARYPGTASATETIVDHRTADGFTEISPVSGPNFFRPPQAGDSHWGSPSFNIPRVIGPSEWVCPGPRPMPRPALPPGVIRRDFNEKILESAREI